MNINTIYKLILDILNKNQQGDLTPEQFNRYINQAQRNYLDYLLGEYQKYMPTRPFASVEFSGNERIRQSIAPLIYGAILSPNSSTGISPTPSDYEYIDAMWGVYGHYNIRFIQQDRLDSYYHSSIDPIATNPVYLINHEGFQFYPENIGQTRLSYVRTPPTIKWAFVEDLRGRPIYDPLNSIDPVWSEVDIYEIIVRVLAMTGISLQINNVVQYSNDIKNNGQ
jgi:hypothetical protein